MQTIRIGKKVIGPKQPVFIIAEAGVNHNGSLRHALELVDAAAMAGADAVKFQTFKAAEVTTAKGNMAAYQKRNTGKDESQLAMLRTLELKESFYTPLLARCRKRRILFLSTPHGGFESVDFLVREKIEALKFGSGDLTNLPLLAYAARFKLPMILGTGMATLVEVRTAMRTIHRAGNRQVVALHCTTNYPCPPNEVDLRAMQTMQEKISALIGYSDHTLGIQVPIMAATLGACVIEKHFTLDRRMEGPDHAASLEPRELGEMVRAIHAVETILGSAEKRPHASEQPMIVTVRKSIVTTRRIEKGEKLTRKNIGIKRPGTGIPPAQFIRIIGKRAKKLLPSDHLLKPTEYGA